MAISAKLQQRQSQSLVMTPQLMQSIKLLQYSNLELQQFIAGELEKNPILETAKEEDFTENRNEAELPVPSSDTANADDKDIRDVVTENLHVQQAGNESPLDTSMDNVFDAGTAGADANNNAGQIQQQGPSLSHNTATPNSYSGDNSSYNLEAFVADSISIQQHLLEQASLAIRDPLHRAIAGEIIASMDEDGYLRRDLGEIAEIHQTNRHEVQKVLSCIHTLDPPGICARDLAECLQIQLEQKNRNDPMILKLLANLQLLAKHDYDGLMKVCDASAADLKDMIEEIRALSPRPASLFDSGPVNAIAPDVFVRAKPDGGWAIELNSDALPKVLVNRSYYAEISKSVHDEKDKEFMVDCLQNANWLVKSLDQRAQTILKVTTEIVKQQDMFFAYGVEHLKPLNLKMVAENTQLHESTVSRVTSNKYLMTERGIFEMKYFFTVGIAATDSDNAH